VSISTPCYATREDVKAALDVKLTARNDQQVDRAIESASRSVEGQMRRVFYPTVTTRYIDWPNYQRALPWRVWLDQWEVADPSTVVVTTGSVTIPAGNIFWEPANSGPPYNYFELDRSTNSAFGYSTTPQRDVHITGAFGYWTNTAPAGVLAAAVTDATATAVTVTDSSAVGVGDNVVIGTERLLVTDKAMITTAQTQQGTGCSTASAADNLLGVTDGTQYFPGETILMGAERMLIIDVAGNNLSVKRSWDGTALATHSAATIYAPRSLTVARGALGTTAATHPISSVISKALVPALIKELTVGEALVAVIQETGGYAKTQGSGDNQQSGVGTGLADIRKRAKAQYARQTRKRVI
jgi:hypothetical protein